jgi:hypothetical protein
MKRRLKSGESTEKRNEEAVYKMAMFFSWYLFLGEETSSRKAGETKKT